jgi:TonB family protein
MMIALLLAALQPVPAADAEPPRLIETRPAISYDDYPQDSIRRSEAGVVSVLLKVSAQGIVTDCQVTESSLSKRLDEHTCKLLSRRTRFAPAADATGRAIAGEYRMSTPWALGDDLLARTTLDGVLQVAALPSGYARPAKVQLVYYAAGAAKECTVLSSSGSGVADRTACDYAIRSLPAEAPKGRSKLVPSAAVRYFNASFAVDQVASR